MLVLPDADLDLAADAAVNAGFGSAASGAWPSPRWSPSSPSPTTWSRIVDRMGGCAPATAPAAATWGRSSPARTATRSTGYVAAGVEEGATLVVDGRDADFDGGDDGFFLAPTLFDHVTPEMSIYRDEIFGPVLRWCACTPTRRGCA